ncbi:MAG TPA: SHOCT domain-containing protein [Chitinispirillaceae bacterium]|nr:SHOCT domain-containing protein [Chitinispirillaceae bacterium]
MEKTCMNRFIPPFSLQILNMYSICTCSQSAQSNSAATPFDGWVMVVIIAAVLVGIAWVSMFRQKKGESVTNDQILLDLNEKLEKGLISKDEYERRKSNLDL